jgi:hypothetical protein
VVCFEVELHGRRRWGGSTKLLTSLQTESRKCEREREREIERNRQMRQKETGRDRERKEPVIKYTLQRHAPNQLTCSNKAPPPNSPFSYDLISRKILLVGM